MLRWAKIEACTKYNVDLKVSIELRVKSVLELINVELFLFVFLSLSP